MECILKTLRKTLLAIIFLSFSTPMTAIAQQMQSDNGDGTYTNPVIYSDFPDPDVIRVDSTYYMVSTTMFIFPGVTILKSYDLVNWEYCSNAVQRFDFSSCYNLAGCNRYSHGQWATSLKYKNGRYYLLFITLDEGGFLCTATKPEGPWQIKKLPRGFYDPGLFFDDDGKIYVGHGNGTIHVTELGTNFVAKGSDTKVFTGDIRSGLEGTHVYKINGYYYLYCTYGGGDGFQVALRSRNIYGPYEEKIVIRDNGNLGTGIHQGALIETQTGEWWSVIFQDGGAFGRFPTLQPVTWQDDWPMLGVNGKGVVTYKKPNVGREYPITTLPTSDEFDDTALGMQWGWNHNPDSTKWSLTQNPGYLRLTTAKVVSDLRNARNTLTQRIFAYYSRSIPTTATTKVDVDNMQDGDVAGLAVFQDPYAFIAIKKTNGIKYAVMVNNGRAIDSAVVNASAVFLRASANYGNSRASFAYGFDNQSFKKLGNDLAMAFNLSIFTGNKFCLFNYPTIATGGYVDFDYFRIDNSLTGPTAAEESKDNIPTGFNLYENYPNPFNPTTQISYSVPQSSYISLKVYNLLGQEVATLFEGIRRPGNYEATFDGNKLATGVCLYRLSANGFVKTRKSLLIR
jgi:beta-xylosidase